VIFLDALRFAICGRDGYSKELAMSETPIYTSKSTVKSLWQEYNIFYNRLEFNTHFGLMTIPFEHVEGIDVSESEVKGLVKGDLHLKNFRPALKLDWANFLEHIVIDKSEGYIRRLLLTPDDPANFKSALDEALRRFRKAKHTSTDSADV
jgi:hypothetical protein